MKIKNWFWLWILLLGADARADIIGHHEGARDLKFSGNGKIAFSSGADGTRVWDVESKRELSALPIQAGSVVAVAEDGKRVLCRHGEPDAKQKIVDFTLWWQPQGIWQKGTQVRVATAQKLLDALFVNNEVILLWEQTIERRGADGSSRSTRDLKGIPRWPYDNDFSHGVLSPTGALAVICGSIGDKDYAFIYDVSGERPLRKINLYGMAWRTEWKFSLNSEVVGAVVGEWVHPWGPNEGPQPAQFTRSLWNVRTGAELSSQSYSLSLTFLPDSKRTLLVENINNTPEKLALYDVFTKKLSLLPFSQPWGERALKILRVSHDGKKLIALDEKGDIWLEQMRPIS